MSSFAPANERSFAVDVDLISDGLACGQKLGFVPRARVAQLSELFR